jgi:hypothetical protein
LTPVAAFIQKRKYELLLAGLLQHLFIGIFLRDLAFYTTVIWPLNMSILGVASTGIFMEKGKWKSLAQGILFLLVLLLPIGLPFIHDVPWFMQTLSAIYVLFFAFILWEVLRFLIRPGYINLDIISASACGYFLLIEIGVFLFQVIFYHNPQSFRGVAGTDPASTYMDFVYFCSITLTSIGFGDIIPGIHQTKLLTSLLGIAGQFYSVILVGIIISKFTSKGHNK